MRRAWFRSILFNITFTLVTLVLCISYIPALLLPRKMFTALVRFWIHCVTAVEYCILGLSYEVRGREHLPTSGAYIVAAKHQSAYETIKLRVIFKDPAIILKKELLAIPMWGWYLKKSGVIAIDRGTPEKALRSMTDGAVKMAEAGRPIVIFPQGTRVRPETTTDEKPYKPGIARIQDATNLPIIPLALNTGLFWPKGSWLKSPGKVVFEFLPAIAPGSERKDLMKVLETKIEAESNRLMNEARADVLNDKKSPVKSIVINVVMAAVLFGGYTVLWNQAAAKVRELYIDFLKDAVETERIHAEPVISGYPGPIRLTVAEEAVTSEEGTLRIENLVMSGWPVPFTTVHITTGAVNVKSFKWMSPLAFESFEAYVSYFNDKVTIHDSSLVWQQTFEAKAEGTMDLKQEPVPKVEGTVLLKNFAPFIQHLAASGIIEPNQALFATAGLSLSAGGSNEASVPITQNGSTLYAGPLPVASLPDARRPVPRSQPDLGQ